MDQGQLGCQNGLLQFSQCIDRGLRHIIDMHLCSSAYHNCRYQICVHCSRKIDTDHF